MQSVSTVLDTRQSAVASQKMIQSIAILQMNAAELDAYLQQQLEENPLLEPEESAEEDGDIVWTEFTGHKDNAVGSDASPLEFVAAEDLSSTLEAFLRDQILRRQLPEWEKRACLFLAMQLDDQGYLRSPSTAVLGRLLGLDRPLTERAIALLQSFEPAGVGARDLRECLLLQLRRQQNRDVEQQVVESCLPLLAKGYYKEIARQLNCPLGRVELAVQRIRALEPRPGSGFACGQRIVYIQPDVSIEVQGDTLSVRLVEPEHRLRLNHDYDSLLETGDAGTQSYLREKYTSAGWLVECLRRRQDTIKRCMTYLTLHQQEYFLGHTHELSPMTLADVAQGTGLHESTVCRALRDKYVRCRDGTVPVDCFFQRGVPGQRDQVSAQQVKLRLRELIKGEDPASPLSDQELTDRLTQQLGPCVSRRTVAKYRGELHIPSRSQRRCFKNEIRFTNET